MPTSPDTLPPAPPETWRLVDEGLAALGLGLEEGARAALEAQLRLLLAWNGQVNLTALHEPEQVARGHLLDSLSALPLLRRLQSARRPAGGLTILDLGSGAGYPGLPLAVALPARRVALVDSVGKKAAFLATAGEAAVAAMRQAGGRPPELTAIAERGEDLADDPAHREAWDVVVARAVGSLAEVAELGLPLVRLGGHVVCWKREPEPGGLRDEINAAFRVISMCGGDRPRVSAPDRGGVAGLADHRLVVVRKVRATPARFPRPVAQRRRAALR